MNFHHDSVMLDEVMNGLNLKPHGIYVDCTLGGGGHASEILKRTSPHGRLIGLDQDQVALKAAGERLKGFGERVTTVHSNFNNLALALERIQVTEVDGILFDLGVSSPQLDNPQRGFSYMHDAPLDMRMNQENPYSAKELINQLSEQELTQIIKDYGEEKWAKRIAKFITAERKKKPISTTFELVEIIKKAIPAAARREGPHPAKRTFQAIRIKVNDELGILKNAFIQGVRALKPGGRICVITFHSLEDRITKETFKHMAAHCICPPELPYCTCNKKQELKIITRKPIEPTIGEVELNPRSRSAKLRVAEKLA